MECSPVQVRPFIANDRAAILALAPRLTIGIAPWLDPTAMLKAARGWLEGGIAKLGPDSAIFVAVDGEGTCAGFVSVARQGHFTGEERAYVGELVVAAEAERRGIGGALVAAAEAWATSRGLSALELDTGAANGHARNFYRRLGFDEESVKLVKRLDPDGDGASGNDTTQRGYTER